MSLESATYINDLNTANPTASDPKSQGDDHIRTIKTVLKKSFAGFAGAVLVTGTDGGAANAYTVTTGQSLAAYSTKMLILFSPVANSTGASTINVDGIGAVSIKTDAGAAIALNDLVANRLYLGAYNGTEVRLLHTLKNYIDQLAFSTALPAQVADYFVTSNGSVASFSNLLKASVIRFADSTDTTKKIAFDASGITTGTTRTISMPDRDVVLGNGWYLLATDTVSSPTPAINRLSLFSSTYDDYMIVIENLSMASADTLAMCLAVAGAADNGGNYNYAGSSQPHTGAGVDVGTSGTVRFPLIFNNADPALHQSAIITMCGVNTANNKHAFSKAAYKANGGNFYSDHVDLIYQNSAVVTGFTLFLVGGANIDAGTVKVYGMARS